MYQHLVHCIQQQIRVLSTVIHDRIIQGAGTVYSYTWTEGNASYMHTLTIALSPDFKLLTWFDGGRTTYLASGMLQRQGTLPTQQIVH